MDNAKEYAELHDADYIGPFNLSVVEERIEGIQLATTKGLDFLQLGRDKEVVEVKNGNALIGFANVVRQLMQNLTNMGEQS